MNSSENGNMVMPVSPLGGYGGYGGNGGFGDNGWWIVLLLLFAANGWGNNGFGNGGGAMPYVLNQGTNADVQRGFDQSATMSALSGLQSSVNAGFGDTQTALCSGFGNIQTALCGGFAGTTAAVTNAQNALAQQMYGNQLADLNRSFDAQTASMQGMNALQSQLAQCCCDNRLATAQTQALVQSENCADRAAIADGLRDIIVNNTANTQRILDQLCNDKIDAKNERIAQLQQELLMRDLADSQTAQTARLLSDNAAQTNALEQYLAPVPRPAYVVQNPNCCSGNWYSGCGCGNVA